MLGALLVHALLDAPMICVYAAVHAPIDGWLRLPVGLVSQGAIACTLLSLLVAMPWALRQRASAEPAAPTAARPRNEKAGAANSPWGAARSPGSRTPRGSPFPAHATTLL
jgi:hypothetical protein